MCNEENNNDDSLIFEESPEEALNFNLIEHAMKSDEAAMKPCRNNFNWEFHSKWEALDACEDFLAKEGFVIFDNKVLACGQKFYLRCERVPKDRKRSEWCQRRYIIFMPSNNLDIILQCNSLQHNHNELLNGKKRLISNEMLAFIHDLYDKQTTKAVAVINHIDSARENQKLFMHEPSPNFKQLEYCLKNYRAGGEKEMVHIGDVMNKCEKIYFQMT